jgi:hypothetical protein
VGLTHILSKPEALEPRTVTSAEFGPIFTKKTGIFEFVPDTDFAKEIVSTR